MAVKRTLRRVATDFLTSPAGRMLALAIDVIVLLAAYGLARVLGRRVEP
jgi:hypothetical protein